MEIYVATHLTAKIADAFQRLIPQLSSQAKVPAMNDLEEIITSGNTEIIICQEEEITGTLTIVYQKTPTGEKAWIEDVIVDNSARGKGVGEKLMLFAIEHIRNKKIKKIDLTSAPERIAANKLYRKLGFKKRETNAYRLLIHEKNNL
jgi:ribosomal protein S18 acetylase RimI-like enzyme